MSAEISSLRAGNDSDAKSILRVASEGVLCRMRMTSMPVAVHVERQLRQNRGGFVEEREDAVNGTADAEDLERWCDDSFFKELDLHSMRLKAADRSLNKVGESVYVASNVTSAQMPVATILLQYKSFRHRPQWLMSFARNVSQGVFPVSISPSKLSDTSKGVLPERSSWRHGRVTSRSNSVCVTVMDVHKPGNDLPEATNLGQRPWSAEYPWFPRKRITEGYGGECVPLYGERQGKDVAQDFDRNPSEISAAGLRWDEL
ncbi:hypothetical protein DFH08DRAFT_936989 [Mycena albidolilacea]|uniref:Uncharacterized protein n=1 Tax=Mycena albidolilacea TaxID=1033008 RepID=A0AAD7A1E5_9AGAR|nr:hypothetical protein DFH08DRAFT_936989 [Mycena albidolilacea]